MVDYSLYLVTDRELLRGRDFATCLAEAVRGGVSLVQVREKNAATREFLEQARSAKTVTTRYNIPLIINDRMDIALAVDADGLHLGQDDLPLPLARKFLAPGKIIGVSVSNVAEAVLAEQQGADYLGVGAMFPTSTKGDAADVTLAELTQIKRAVHIPVVAIGGINAHNAQQVMSCGIDGISVVSAILGSEEIYAAANVLRNLLNT